MNQEKSNWLDRNPIPAIPWLTVEMLLFGVIILIAIITRFYDLETRVMSHDESLHTFYSWELFRGKGYVHNPMMRGPLQFHMLALSYFIFGVSDFTARIPAVLFSIATVWVLWYWRRYLGRWGVLMAGIMMVISPYMLYYGRYVRNESFVALFGVLTLYATLRYLESGENRFLYLLSAATVLHFTVKETSFIYTAQLLIFLAALFVVRVLRHDWGERNENGTHRNGFIFSMIIAALGIGGALAVAVINKKANGPTPEDAVMPSAISPGIVTSAEVILALVGLLAIVAGGYFLLTGFHLQTLRKERSFDLLMLVGSLILPMLVAFPVYMMGYNPMDYALPPIETWTSTGTLILPSIIVTAIWLVIIGAIAALIGWFWNWGQWWRSALLFYGIFTVFYTTLFTNGPGFFTGLVGSLGYWLEQQGVERGSQPWYYYVLLQVPIYEFLPFLAALLAAIMGLWKLPQASQMIQRWIENQTPQVDEEAADSAPDADAPEELIPAPALIAPPSEIPDLVQWNLPNSFALLGWWSLSSLLAFTIAGEKMPWLTVHITLPMILFGGWALGSIAEGLKLENPEEKKPWLMLALLFTLVASLSGLLLCLLGSPLPFGGSELAQLTATSNFIFSVVGLLASLVFLFRLLTHWSFQQMASVFALIFFGLLGLLTARAAFRANYVLYDSGMEYLVYAHGYTGNKDVLKQVMELSSKTTGDPYAIVVGYDDDVSWPMSWYMREFPNNKYYGNTPNRELTREASAIIVGDNNFSKIEPLVGDKFYRFDYVRMVWPNQDYFNLDGDRISAALGNPEMRAALLQIWLNRDYTLYGQVTGSDRIKPENWDPGDRMRLYVNKEVLTNIWSYGVAPVSQEIINPYSANTIQLAATQIIGGVTASDPGMFNAPRAVAFAPDGSFYVADSRNHRIQKFSADGQFISQWGSFGDLNSGTALDGTFNEPWGVAVGPDGSVYVSDTWNHRIQKFDKDGKFIRTWGNFGLSSEGADRLYGPRGLEVDALGRVFVADTGNKRIAIFDSNGIYLGEFGGEGVLPGQFYEPVDVAIDPMGLVYITDTWNQRVQVMVAATSEDIVYMPLREWPVNGWKSDTLDNKPYIAIAPNGNVLITDPEGYRVIEFTSSGEFVRTWGDYGTEEFAFGLVSGITVAPDGSIWVVDAGNARLMRFLLP